MKPKIEYLYNKKLDTSIFYIWNNMELIDKFIYKGEMSIDEIKTIKTKLEKKIHNTQVSKS